MEESKKALTTPIAYPKGLPRDVWAYIAGFLDLEDLGRFAQVCVAFHHVLSVTNGKVLNAWFRDLKRQCVGEGEVQVSQLLDYCQKNMRQTSALLSVLDKLLHVPRPGEPVPVLEDPVLQTADALSRRVYADPRNNPLDTLRRALMSIIENNDRLIARSEIIVKRDKIFDQRIEKLPYVGLGLVIVGLLVQFSQWENPQVGRMMAMPFMLPGLFVGSSIFYKDTGIVDYYKHRGFWRKVDALPSEELDKIPHLKRIRDGYNDNWNNLKFVGKIVTGGMLTIVLLMWLLVQYLLRNTDVSYSPRQLGPSGP